MENNRDQIITIPTRAEMIRLLEKTGVRDHKGKILDECYTNELVNLYKTLKYRREE